jgi:hypothetical protein
MTTAQRTPPPPRPLDRLYANRIKPFLSRLAAPRPTRKIYASKPRTSALAQRLGDRFKVVEKPR